LIHDLGAALSVTYLWLKAGHVIFVIFWMAGMFMLPRFYVYHQEAAPGSDEERGWIERERKLRHIIITPSMILVWVFGLTLATVGNIWPQHWFHAKLLLVVLLSAYHGWLVRYGKRLVRGGPRIPERTLRLMNELPGIAVVLIVVLVIVRPF